MISFNTLNHLRNAKTQDGMVGMKVSANGGQSNLAWLTIQIPNRGTGFNEEFRIEYSEFKPEWQTDDHDGWDWDLYLINELTEYASSVDELKTKLDNWTSNYDDFTPIANLDHTKY